MNFVSWAFVVLFLAVFAYRLTLGRRKTEGLFLGLVMVLSTIFVMWHVPVYIGVMLVSIVADYAAAVWISRSPEGSARRKWLLVFSIAVNLSLLGFFKYTDFAIDSVGQILAALNIKSTIPRLNLILPMGISFYTFCSMSYTIDVYRGHIKPVKRFRDFYYFVTFFPHLVAGPIIRAEQFFYQLPRTRRPRLRVFNAGVFLIIRGLFLKMVCADNIAVMVNANWESGYRVGAGSLSLLLLAVLFAVQIFCDFEGYSSIARGLAYLMGFRFPVNFNCPYIATSFRNFWERWHITLSQWLRDYLYVPLGGNRVSKRRTYVNLMAVMVLGGLWHGAAVTFIAWGLLHGVGLAVERLLGFHKLDKSPGAVGRKIAWYVVVQAVVLVTWVFFRSDTIGHALTFVGNMAACRLDMPASPLWTVTFFVLPVVAMHIHRFLVERGILKPVGLLGKAVLAAVMLYATMVFYGASSSFIYFQF